MLPSLCKEVFLVTVNFTVLHLCCLIWVCPVLTLSFITIGIYLMFNGQLVSTVLLDSLNVHNFHASLVLVYLCFDSLVYFMYMCVCSVAFLVFMFFFIVFRPTILSMDNCLKVYVGLCMYVLPLSYFMLA